MATFDVFISYANEDKEAVAKPLVQTLRDQGYTVWFDEHVLKVGDNLRREIDKGLSSCRYGIVIFSHNFFAKEWPQRELDALASREARGEVKVILPVWHGIDHDDMLKYSPMLADRLGVSTARGIGEVAKKIVDVLGEISRTPRTQLSEAQPLVQSPVEVFLLEPNPKRETFGSPVRLWTHFKVSTLPGTFWGLAIIKSRESLPSPDDLNKALEIQNKQMPNFVSLHWSTLTRIPAESTIGKIQKPRVVLIIEEEYQIAAEMFRQMFLNGPWAGAIAKWQQDHEQKV